MMKRETERAEHSVSIADRMYEARRALKGVYRADYDRRIAGWKMALRELQTEAGRPLLEVVLHLIRRLMEHDKAVSVMHVLAAAVDIIEEGE